jgi:hypothetical protein
MKITLSILATFILLLGCSKDKFKTTPQIELKSFSPAEVNNKDFLNLKATITDKEGDLKDTIYIVNKRYNLAGDTLLTQDTIDFDLGTLAFPEKDKIDIEIIYSYGELRPSITKLYLPLENRERRFAVGLIIKDKAGNRSEYVETEKVVLKTQ